MTPENQRIAIAEACGWSECKPCKKNGYDGKWRLPDDSGCKDTLPDYLNDLNSMHEAILTLEVSQWRLFVTYLQLASVKGTSEDATYRDICLIGSTAAQRAEAFLKTLNLWKD